MLTEPHGLNFITSCEQEGFHTHPKEPPLYEVSEYAYVPSVPLTKGQKVHQLSQNRYPLNLYFIAASSVSVCVGTVWVCGQYVSKSWRPPAGVNAGAGNMVNPALPFFCWMQCWNVLLKPWYEAVCIKTAIDYWSDSFIAHVQCIAQIIYAKTFKLNPVKLDEISINRSRVDRIKQSLKYMKQLIVCEVACVGSFLSGIIVSVVLY